MFAILQKRLDRYKFALALYIERQVKCSLENYIKVTKVYGHSQDLA